MIKYTLKPVI